MISGRQWDRLSRFVGQYSLRAGLWAADRRAAYFYRRSLGGRYNHVPRPDAVKSLFGISDPEEYREYCRKHLIWHCRKALIRHFAVEGRLEHSAPLVRWKDPDLLRSLIDSGKPLVFTSFHASPSTACWSGLVPLGLKMIRAQRTPWKAVPPGWKFLRMNWDYSNSVVVLKKCLRHLRKGGHVAITLDGGSNAGDAPRFELLGRQVRNPKGVTTLAQMAEATLVMLAGRWLPNSYEVEIDILEVIPFDGDSPDDPEAYELEALRKLIKAKEAHILKYPWCLPRGWVHSIANRPRIGADETGGDKPPRARKKRRAKKKAIR